MFKKIFTTTLFACAFILASCSFSSNGSSLKTKGKRVELSANPNGGFTPFELTANAGEWLTIDLKNNLSKKLNFILLKKNENALVVNQLTFQLGENQMSQPPKEYVIFSSDIVEPNTSTSFYLQIPKEAGDYAFVSTLNHERLYDGMIKVIDKKVDNKMDKK